MKISIVMSYWNRLSYLERALSTIVSQTFPKENYEIIIIEGGEVSCDTLVQSFRNEYGADIRLEKLPQQRQWTNMWSLPCNVGIRLAKYPLIMFANQDELWRDDILQSLSDRHEKDDKLLSYAYHVWNVNDYRAAELPRRPTCQEIKRIQEQEAPLMNFHQGAWNWQGVIANWEGDVYRVPFNLSCLRTEHMIAVGGFDEAFYGYGWAENDIAWRLLNYGLHIEQSKSAFRLDANTVEIRDIVGSDYGIIHLNHIFDNRVKHPPIDQNKLVYDKLHNMKKGEYLANVGKEWGRI